MANQYAKYDEAAATQYAEMMAGQTMQALADAWYEQGYNHAQSGGNWCEWALFSKEHQQGYIDALKGVRVVFLSGGAALNRLAQ